jgi:hypothetical protein
MTLEVLKSRGGTDWKIDLSLYAHSWLSNALKRLETKGILSYKGRVMRNISGWKIPKKVWKEILSDDLITLLEQYLGHNPRLRGVQVIEVDNNQPEQSMHRDHREGSKILLMLGISFCGNIGTLIIPKSHHSKPNETFHKKYAEPIGNSNSVLFDGYAIHGGCNTYGKEKSRRLFICFESSSISDQTLLSIKNGHGSKATKSIPISILI